MRARLTYKRGESPLGQVEHIHAVRRGVCPRCSRPLKCSRFAPPTSTWRCSSSSCSFVIEMPKASVLYRRARLAHELGEVA